MANDKRDTYLIPMAHVTGTLAEMLFADAVYFLFADRGVFNRDGARIVETTTAELETLTGLTRKTIRKQLDRLLLLPPPFQLVEEAGVLANGRLLKQPHYAQLQTERHLLKPCAFMRQKWGWVLAQPLPNQNKSSRFPYALFNVMWRKPNGRFTSFQELQQRSKKQGARKLPDSAPIYEALRFLQNLGLVEEQNGRFRLLKAQVWQSAAPLYASLMAPKQPQANVWVWAEEEAPERVSLAQEIAALGQYDTAVHAKEIFYDLAHIQPDTDLKWLRYAAQRHRHRPPSPERWRNCWQLFKRTLQRQRYGGQSAKHHLTFQTEMHHTLHLTLPNHRPNELRWGKLVVWVQDGRFLATGIGRTETVLVQLQDGDELLWQRRIGYEDSVVRCDLTAVLRQANAPTFHFLAETAVPLPQFSLDVQLECEYIK